MAVAAAPPFFDGLRAFRVPATRDGTKNRVLPVRTKNRYRVIALAGRPNLCNHCCESHQRQNVRSKLMASITIRNLEDGLKSRLRVQAAVHGRSMEDEARDILRSALSRQTPPAANLAETIHARFAALGGADLPIAPREPMPEPPAFD
jgi:plasmid stability protein